MRNHVVASSACCAGSPPSRAAPAPPYRTRLHPFTAECNGGREHSVRAGDSCANGIVWIDSYVIQRRFRSCMSVRPGVPRALRALALLLAVSSVCVNVHALSASPTPGAAGVVAAADASPSASPPPPVNYFCGDGVCSAAYLRLGETCGNCPQDCGPCQPLADATACVEDRVVAMGFSAGPSPVTRTLLAVLAGHNAHATFFPVGANMTVYPGLIQAEVAGGHSTLAHSNTLTPLTSQSLPATYNEFALQSLDYQMLTCRRPTLYRPPGDLNDDAHRGMLQRMGFRNVGWNLDTQDTTWTTSQFMWALGNFTAELASLSPSGVLTRQHDTTAEAAALTPLYFNALTSAGYSTVTVERCIWGPNYTAHPSWVFAHRYCNDPAVIGMSQKDATAVWPSPTPDLPCPLSDWGEWSPCDAACGSGTQTRARLTLPPSRATTTACTGVDLVQLQTCANPSLPAACGVVMTPSSCPLSEWVWWNASVSCGAPVGVQGTQVQYRRVVLDGDTRGIIPGSQLNNADVAAVENLPLACGAVTRTVLCVGTIPVQRLYSFPSPLPVAGDTVTPNIGSGSTTSSSEIIGLSALGAIVMIVCVVAWYLKKKLIATDLPPTSGKGAEGGHGGDAHTVQPQPGGPKWPGPKVPDLTPAPAAPATPTAASSSVSSPPRPGPSLTLPSPLSSRQLTGTQNVGPKSPHGPPSATTSASLGPALLPLPLASPQAPTSPTSPGPQSHKSPTAAATAATAAPTAPTATSPPAPSAVRVEEAGGSQALPAPLTSPLAEESYPPPHSVFSPTAAPTRLRKPKLQEALSRQPHLAAGATVPGKSPRTSSSPNLVGLALAALGPTPGGASGPESIGAGTPRSKPRSECKRKVHRDSDGGGQGTPLPLADDALPSTGVRTHSSASFNLQAVTGAGNLRRIKQQMSARLPGPSGIHRDQAPLQFY